MKFYCGIDLSARDCHVCVIDELEQWFAHPLVRLHASQELQRIELYSQQIAELEKTILALAKTEQSYELLLQLPGVSRKQRVKQLIEWMARPGPLPRSLFY